MKNSGYVWLKTNLRNFYMKFQFEYHPINSINEIEFVYGWTGLPTILNNWSNTGLETNDQLIGIVFGELSDKMEKYK